MAWVVYVVLPVGRWRLDWRGRPVIHWTLGGFFLLLLAYFGSKFVLEILLKRG
ncbi:MAG: cytochrome c biogenesis protein CcsA [Pseudomonadota bacterium]